MKIAAIDIGSNALRLLIKDTASPNFLSELETLREGEYYERIPLKSGMDVFASGEILPPTKIKLSLALRHFAEKMREHGVSRYRACATSAYRDARNGMQVAEAVGKDTGLSVEVISGDEEARLTRLSFTPPEGLAADYFLFVDVGGGSTEVSVMHEGRLLFGHSFQVGSMRYLCGNQDEAEVNALDRKIAELHRDFAPLHYIATGGCVKFMSKYLKSQSRKVAKSQSSTNNLSTCQLVNSSTNTIIVSEMQAVYADLKTKTVQQIVSDYGLPEERADILTPAASIFLRIAHGLGAEEITVPAIGVRNGILAELYLQATGSKQP